MKFTLKEMNGLLNGICLPSDLIVGESLAEYLVRKFSTLEQKLIESERYGRQTDITIDNLEMKLAQMAAENAGLKALCEDRRTFIMNGVQLGYIQVPTVETDPALETIRVAVSPQESTPSTDAFLAEVRAQVADEALKIMGNFTSDECGDSVYIAIKEFAENLRKGVQS